jgi:hypothetical protein
MADLAERTISIGDVILALCSQQGPAKTICPTEAARAWASLEGGDDLAWQSYVANVRAAAVRLAKAGRVVIYRKGKPVDPDAFRGVYRLGLTRDDEACRAGARAVRCSPAQPCSAGVHPLGPPRRCSAEGRPSD